jgi:hypothetical protein
MQLEEFLKDEGLEMAPQQREGSPAKLQHQFESTMD